jgi:hypothetical protein
MPRAKINKTRVTALARTATVRLMQNQKNYEILLGMATADFLRIRAMEYLSAGDTDKAMDMLLLDKVLA